MSEKEIKDKIKLKILLETYSFEEIASIFSEVDKKIQSLHDCSSEDFLRLNSDFKKIHADSKVVNANTNQILEILAGENGNRHVEEIEVGLKLAGNGVDEFSTMYKNTMNSLNLIASKIRNLFFPLKNFNQNLVSLKFLFANLNLGFGCDDDDRCKEIEKKIDSMIEKIIRLKDRGEKSLSILNTSRKIIKDSEEKYFSEIDGELNDFKESAGMLQKYFKPVIEKVNEYILEIPEIQNKSNESQKKTEEIITKLQYHDIIKQKISHIQNTQLDLIRDLAQIEKEEHHKFNEHDKAKAFIKVRDIAGLQAAQLLHANKEYQAAIEIITSNFIQMGDTVKWVSDFCNKVYKKSDFIFDAQYGYSDKVKELGQLITSFFNIQKRFQLYSDDIQLNIDKTITIYKEIDDLMAEIKSESKKIIDSIQIISKDRSVVKMTDQVQQLLNEIIENSNNQQSVITFIQEKNSYLLKELVNFKEEDSKEELKRLAAVFDNELNSKIDGSELKKLLKENDSISSAILDMIKKSISDIKYYDLFEKVIDEIIKELNTVNYRLKTFEEDGIENAEENLKHLREYYTMETEHIIHNEVTMGNKEIELEINDDEVDIEFF